MSYAGRLTRVTVYSPTPSIEAGERYLIDDGWNDAVRSGWFEIDVKVYDDQAVRFYSKPEQISFGHDSAFEINHVYKVV